MKNNSEKAAIIIKESQQYTKTILNSLSAHIAIIDENGVILETNRAWKQFANSNQLEVRPEICNVNYLEICDKAQGESADKAKEVAKGIRSVINGDIEEFVIDYPCHSPDQKRKIFWQVAHCQSIR